MSETRVVLVKPGDVLIFGNVGDLSMAQADLIRDLMEPLKEQLGLARVLVFEADIDLAALPKADA